MSNRKVYILILVSFLTACVSQISTIDEHVNGYIGKPISQIQELYKTPKRSSVGFFKTKTFAWKESQSQFINGNTLYSYKNPYKDCVINWIADNNNIIISGSYSGEGCR